MANVQITQLPNAEPLTGTESVPIVQNGITVKTTTAAIAQSPILNQTFLTVNLESTLPNSRYFSTDANLTITDNGALSSYVIGLTGSITTLNPMGLGLVVKTDSLTFTPREILTTGAGISISNGDGISGDPTIGLSGLPLILAQATGSGLLSLASGTSISPVTITGTAGQISVANGTGVGGNPTISITNSGVSAGTYTLATITVGADGRITSASSGTASSGTVTSVSVVSANGFAGTVADPTSTPAITISTTVTGILKGDGTAISAATSGVDYAPATSGSSILYGNGLGGFSDVTIGTGLSFVGGTLSATSTGSVTSVTASAPLSSSGGTSPNISITQASSSSDGYLTSSDWTTFNNKGSGTVTSVSGTGSVNGITLTGTVTSTGNLTLGGSLGNIGNSQLTNSSFTINGTSVSLGGSATISAANFNALTIGTGLTGTSYDGSAPVTIAIDSSVVTLTGTQTLSNKTLDTPKVTNQLIFSGTGVSTYTPFANTLASWQSDVNDFQVFYLRNLNNGTDASSDFVAYNDASDVNSYFIDMGINSSNYSSTTYPIFTTNSGYVFTGGGSGAIPSDLFFGTSTVGSDIIFFTEGVDPTDEKMRIKHNGNLMLGTTTDTGELLQVNGTALISGATEFGSTVLLSADPTTALEAATKQYVDGTSAGLFIHTPVRVEQGSNLNATYSNGTAGVGATLTNAGTQTALVVDGITVSVNDRVLVYGQTAQAQNGVYVVSNVGSGSTNWVLTRASDADTYAPNSTTALGRGSYFYVTSGLTGAGESYVMTTTGTITFGTTAIVFTQFSGAVTYTGGQNIDVTGQTISFTGTLPATNGGTGTATVTTGDLLYGSATNTWSKLPIGAAYKSLVINASGTQVEWNGVALNQTNAVSGQLGEGNGGTGQASYTTGDILYASGSTTLSKLGIGTSTYILTSSGTAPQWSDPAGITVGTATNATNATNASNVAVTATSTNATYYLTFVSSTSGNQAEYVNSSIQCNPSTGAITGGISGGTF